MVSLMFWNLFESGLALRSGDPGMWRRQVSIIQDSNVDVIALTEGWDWHRDEQSLFRLALNDYGFSDGVLYEAKSGCNMAIMWKDGTSPLAVHRQPLSQAWWHGYMHVTLQMRGLAAPVTIMVSHLNPFDPTLRRIEGSWLRTMMLQFDRGVLVLDANAVPPGDPEPAPHSSRNLPGSPIGDRTPLESLADIGLIDVGAAFGDRRPTWGYYDHGPKVPKTPLRIDQAWATQSLSLKSYAVLENAAVHTDIDTASDHRPIRIEFQ
jgi:hypothetical protein